MSHDLQFWNLVITTGGQCRLSNQFGELRAETGDVLLSPPSKNRFFSVNGAWECIWFGFNLHTHVNWNQPVREIYHVHPGEETFTRIRNDAEEAYALLAEESGNVFPLVENLLENILMRGNAESLFELNPRLEAAKISSRQTSGSTTSKRSPDGSECHARNSSRPSGKPTERRRRNITRKSNSRTSAACLRQQTCRFRKSRKSVASQACFIFQNGSAPSSKPPCAATARKAPERLSFKNGTAGHSPKETTGGHG